MESQAFVEALQALPALPPEIVEHIAGLSPQLSEIDRKDALSSFVAIHEQLLKNRMEAASLHEQAKEALVTFKRKAVPAARNAREDKDRTKDLSAAEELLNNA